MIKLSERLRKGKGQYEYWGDEHRDTVINEVAKLESENERLRDAMRHAIYVGGMGGKSMNYLHRALLTEVDDETK